jgi:uncharacterized protein with HEPN domain
MAQQVDTTGLLIILVDYMADKDGWVSEKKIAEDVKINPQLLSCALAYLVKEFMLSVDHVPGEAAASGRRKQVSVAYYSIDFASLHDVVQYRIHRMRMRYDAQLNRPTKLRCMAPWCMAEPELSEVEVLDDGRALCNLCGGALSCEAGECAAKWRDLKSRTDGQLEDVVQLLRAVKTVKPPARCTLRDWVREGGQAREDEMEWIDVEM